MTTTGEPLLPGAQGVSSSALAAKRAPTWLLEFARNVHSQCGEDGVVEKILSLLPVRDHWCVEFGAWDGRRYSNTLNLIEHQNYSAVLVEGDPTKFRQLQKNFASNPKVITIQGMVGFGAQDGLDHFLRVTSLPHDFDFLSIDVDGNDYHIWKAVTEYQPKLVCIEFNPTVPTEVSFIQAADPSVNQGSSLRALVELGREKGYELVSVLPCNALFVRSCDFNLFTIDDNHPETLRTCLDFVTYIFCGFDGRIHLRGNRTLPWHHFEIKESSIQQLPRFFQVYPLNYGWVRRALFLLYADPREFCKEVSRRFQHLLGRS